MNERMFSAPLRPILTLAIIGFGASAVPAQSYLVVEVKGQGKVVRKCSGPIPYIMEDGKLRGVSAVRCGLVPAPEFLPVFVTVRDIEANVLANLTRAGGGGTSNFRFRATFESPDWLEDVFFVLELEPKQGEKRIYVQGIGRLKPREPREISTTVPLRQEMGAGEAQVHVFSRGMEVFNSDQSAEFRAQALDQMVGKRVAGLKNSPPTPLMGPMPEYPKRLIKSKLKGEAMVKIHVSVTGVLTDPKVESATDPAFGEAAVAAVCQWRFVPGVKEGQPVETTVVMPFAFEPPGMVQKN